RYFNDGPFTAPFGNESSPRTGAWVGWQIVRNYMEIHPKISIHQLLSNSNHMDIFHESGYRP
ncbi:MAG: gliding motility lipoprotein GldB, partial [Bacteroidia bacterium]|nr:gliding motility lipoprotein GldB [Bacteroidia bacterium]